MHLTRTQWTHGVQVFSSEHFPDFAMRLLVYPPFSLFVIRVFWYLDEKTKTKMKRLLKNGKEEGKMLKEVRKEQMDQ